MPSRLLQLFRFILINAALVALAACETASPGPAGPSERQQVAARVDELLGRYAANDQDGVVGMIDQQEFTMYGSDRSEIVHNAGELRQFMTDDFTLWQKAAIGAVQDLDIRIDRNLATAFFHVPFSAGGRPPVVVRFSTTWKRIGQQWFLTQSANAVPTTGSSARELIRK